MGCGTFIPITLLLGHVPLTTWLGICRTPFKASQSRGEWGGSIPNPRHSAGALPRFFTRDLVSFSSLHKAGTPHFTEGTEIQFVQNHSASEGESWDLKRDLDDSV